MQHAVNILSAVFNRLFYSEFLHLFVFALQFLKFQFYATNADLIRTFRG